MKHVQENRIVVVGCSVGGSCALEILNLAPERVAATILIGTKARHDPDPVFFREASKIIENQGVKTAWKQLWEPLFLQNGKGDADASIRKAVFQNANDFYELNLAD